MVVSCVSGIKLSSSETAAVVWERRKTATGKRSSTEGGELVSELGRRCERFVTD